MHGVHSRRLAELKGDVVAGLTTGFAVLPQGLDGGQIAEVPAIVSALLQCLQHLIVSHGIT